MKSLSVKLGIVLLAIGLILGYAEVWGTNWKLFAEYNLVDGYLAYSAKLYYETESIVRTKDGHIRVWIHIRHEKVTIDPPENIPDCRNLIEINCPLREARHLKITKFYKDGCYQEEHRKQWDYISAGESMEDLYMEDLYKAVCGE